MNNYDAVYLYGSRVYGTASEDSDYDYYFIKNGYQQEESLDQDDQFVDGLINYKVMAPEKFQDLLNKHYPTALEILFMPEHLITKKYEKPWHFELSLSQLRHSFSMRANQSFNKAKKKFEKPYDWAENELIRGKKSLFHSLRIINFGIQIAEHGAISDYSALNHYYDEIMKEDSSWDSYEKKWKSIYHELLSSFRKVAPK